MDAVDIITIDVEEWFHGHNYLAHVPPETWDDQEPRVVANTERCLAMLAEQGVRATFFVLGWVAERHPDLVRRIVADGHEIGCHSYGHAILYRLTDHEFQEDLERALAALRAAGAAQVHGYRAPSFSLIPSVHHFLTRLQAQGFRYDASLFPIHHPRYGQSSSPRVPFRLEGVSGEPFAVVPMTTVRLAGINWPFSGGGYQRLLPLSAYRRLRRWAHRQGQPVINYLHPWELDNYRPAVALGRWGKLRSQGGQGSMPGKLAAILAEGRFQTLGDYVERRLVAADLPLRKLPLT